MQENINKEMNDIDLQTISDEELESVSGGATTGVCSGTGGGCPCHPTTPIPAADM